MGTHLYVRMTHWLQTADVEQLTWALEYLEKKTYTVTSRKTGSDHADPQITFNSLVNLCKSKQGDASNDEVVFTRLTNAWRAYKRRNLGNGAKEVVLMLNKDTYLKLEALRNDSAFTASKLIEGLILESHKKMLKRHEKNPPIIVKKKHNGGWI